MSTRTQSLDDLRVQARLTFRYWPIYLMLRQREVDRHLTTQERQLLGTTRPTVVWVESNKTVELLTRYGLWREGLPMDEKQKIEYLTLPEGGQYFFRVGKSLTTHGFQSKTVSLDVVSVAANGVKRLELMRVQVSDRNTLEIACKLLNRIAEEFTFDLAVNSARWWAAAQGSRLLTWVGIPKEFVNEFMPGLPSLAPVATTTADKVETVEIPKLPQRRRGKGKFREPN
jgi:hypothetical protein